MIVLGVLCGFARWGGLSLVVGYCCRMCCLFVVDLGYLVWVGNHYVN